MKIIGHRGVAGLALENTISSIELARLLGVNAIEIDVRKTKDNHLVVCHDSDLSRISGKGEKVSSLTLAELQKIVLVDGHSSVPTLKSAIETAGATPLIVEIKSSGCTEQIIETLSLYPKANISFASFKHSELILLKKSGATNPLIALEATKPFDIVHIAKRDGFDGIGIKFWLLNPLTYILAKRAKLSLYVYTVNNQLIGRLIQRLYPSVDICTDRPELFIKHPWIKIRKNIRR